MPMNQADSTMQSMQSFRNNNDDDTETIDLGELFGVLWHRIWLLILAAVICGTAGYCIARFLIPDQYESTTEIYILNKSDANQNSVNYSDLQVGSQLTKDYSELITSRKVLEQVISDLNLPYDYDQFKDKIEVSTPTDTRIVAITVTDTDPVEAQRMANEIRIDASEQIQNVMEIDAVNVVEEANLPTEKSSPINSRWALIGALIGFIVMAAVIIVQYVMDDSIKTSDDIEKYLGLSTLALIPLDNAVAENSVEVQSKGRKKRKKNSERPERSDGRRSADAGGSGNHGSTASGEHHEHHEHHGTQEKSSTAEEQLSYPEGQHREAGGSASGEEKQSGEKTEGTSQRRKEEKPERHPESNSTKQERGNHAEQSGNEDAFPIEEIDLSEDDWDDV